MMDLVTVNWLSITIRVVLAVLMGGLIGFERESSKHPAGMRTHMLICLGSTLIMITNQYIFQSISASADPARMAAQIVSGIGFLGAGTIIVVGHKSIKGLTTAAGIWASASVGIAIGIGFYYGAVIAGILIFFILKIPRRFETELAHRSKHFTLYVEISTVDTVGALLAYFEQNQIRVIKFKMDKNPEQGCIMDLMIEMELPKGTDKNMVYSHLAAFSGISYME